MSSHIIKLIKDSPRIVLKRQETTLNIRKRQVKMKANRSGLRGQPGNSAYQTWLDLGNEGTEQDFIDSYSDARNSKYDNDDSGLNAENVQTAIDELAARPSGVPDEAWTEFDLEPCLFSIFAGTPLDLGTNGFVYARTTRVGRTVSMKGNIHFDADHADGALGMIDFGLPAMPLPPNPGVDVSAYVSEFAYAVYPETSPGASDGRLEPLGAALGFIGGASAILFVQLSRNDTDGGGGNLYQTTYPFDGSGRPFDIVFAINYEALEAAA